MSGNSHTLGSFTIADYVVFAVMLVVSSAVGFYYACVSKGQGSSSDFLTGGRKLTALPVALSLAAGFLSSTTILSNPAEVYRYGANFIFFGFGYVFAVVISSEVYLPVFYRLGYTSSYEYLELRFNKATRLVGIVLFIFQMMPFTGVVIYGPALTLSQATDMDLWSGILTTGIVCTFYCTLGGFKAVVLTDVIQIGIMLLGYLSVIIISVNFQGGVHTIISDAQQGGRLNHVDFDLNPLKRHTFWSMVIGGTFGWVNVYGVNQAQVQRYVSCKSITHARLAVFINLLCLCVILVCSVSVGICLYSVYKNCDPMTAGLVSAYDELVPYLVMDIMTSYPGLPGLFFAAVCSGSLSTVSSCINALAAVTLEDLIKPYTNMSEKHLFWISKGLSLLYGILCITMAGLASAMGGLMQATLMINGAVGGPVLGLFTLGILFPFTNSIGALSGLLSGMVATITLTIGQVLYPPPPSMTLPLSLTIEGCNSTSWMSTALPTELSTTTAAPVQGSNGKHLLAGDWQSPSYLFTTAIGTLIVITVGLIVSLLTGGLRTKAESKFTLMKEDTTSYHIYTFFKKKVMKTAEKLDLSKIEESKAGNINPAFCETEMEYTSGIPARNNCLSKKL